MNQSVSQGSLPQREVPYQTSLTITCNLSQGDVSVSALYPHGWVPVLRPDNEHSTSATAVIHSISSNILLNFQVSRRRYLRPVLHGQLIVSSNLLRGNVRCPALDTRGVPVALIGPRENHSSPARSVDNSRSDFIGVDLDIEIFFDPMRRRRLHHSVGDARHGNILLPRLKIYTNVDASDEDKDRVLLGKPARIEVIRETNATNPAPGGDPHSPLRFYRF